jgi:tetratricopeptide (TPR) repeat protein
MIEPINPFALAERQSKHRSQCQCCFNGEIGIMRLAAPRRPGLRLPTRQRFFGEPDRQASTIAKRCVIIPPIGHSMPLTENVAPAARALDATATGASVATAAGRLALTKYHAPAAITTKRAAIPAASAAKAQRLSLQDQVVARVANALSYELVSAEAATGAHSKNPDVIDLVMRGNAAGWRFMQQPTKDAKNSIRALFEQALQIDPNDAGALAGDAMTYMIDSAYGWTNPDTDYEAKVLGQADRSIAIVRDDQMPYMVKAQYLIVVHRLDEGLRAADAGLAINPNSALLRAARGLAEIYIGHFEQGKTDVQQAMRLSPRDPAIGAWHNYLCLAQLGLSKFDVAIGEGNSAIDATYQVFQVYTFLAAAHALKGEMAEAKTALAEARRLNPKLTVKMMSERYANIPTLAEGLRKAGLPEE